MDYSKEKELKKLKLNPFNTQCPHMKLHLTNAEVGSRNVECGMWKDGVAALCLFNLKSIECLPSIFDIRYSLFNTNMKALICNTRPKFLSRLDCPLFRPAAAFAGKNITANMLS